MHVLSSKSGFTCFRQCSLMSHCLMVTPHALKRRSLCVANEETAS